MVWGFSRRACSTHSGVVWWIGALPGGGKHPRLTSIARPPACLLCAVLWGVGAVQCEAVWCGRWRAGGPAIDVSRGRLSPPERGII